MKFTCLALSTNFNVFIVSSMFLVEGEILPIINVFVLPTNESWSNLVNFDSRNADLSLESPLDKDFITFPKVVKDKLIFFNSYRCSRAIFYFLLIF